MKIDAQFKQLIRSANSLLKPEGFEKKGLAFFKQLPEINWIVNFQKSRDSIEKGVKFTINLGTFSFRLNRFSWNVPVKTPSIWNCPVLVRIGELLPKEEDTWWKIGTESPAEQVETQVLDAVKAVGLPFLKQFSSDEDLRKYFWKLVRKGEAPYPMVLNLCALEAELGSKNDFLGALQTVKKTAVQVGVPSGAMQNQIKELQQIK